MSNTLAIAAVTSTLRHLLNHALAGGPGPVGMAAISTLHPARLEPNDEGILPKGINVFLYRVTPNHAWNLTDLPTRASTGELTRRPLAALDLHYLISCTGDDAELDSQRLLGRAALALAATPVLGRDLVREALEIYADELPTAFLDEADLANQVELVKIAPEALTLEDESRLWGTLGTAFQLSVTYSATVVLIEHDVMPQAALPVRERVVDVAPIAPPVLAELETDPPGAAIRTGSAVRLRGASLVAPVGSVTSVAFGPAELTPTGAPVAGELTVTVGPEVPAGVHAVQVVHRSAPGEGGVPPSRVVARSAAVPVLVRPEATGMVTSSTEVTLTVAPPLYPGQRASVRLQPLGEAGERTPLAFRLDPVAADGEPSGTVVLARSRIPDGDWLVRLQVAGADSLPRLVGETYGAPLLRLS